MKSSLPSCSPWQLAWLLAGALLAGFQVGCGHGEPASLTGEIRYLDTPVADGGIHLLPLEGTPGKGAVSRIASGRYDMPRAKGLKAGRYLVQVFATRPTGRKIKTPGGEPDAGTMVDEHESYLPDIYGTSSTVTI